MRSRRVRDRNIRLLGERADGSEVLRDFAAVSEAREFDKLDLVDWVVFEIDHPHYAARGRVLDSSEEQ